MEKIRFNKVNKEISVDLNSDLFMLKYRKNDFQELIICFEIIDKKEYIYNYFSIVNDKGVKVSKEVFIENEYDGSIKKCISYYKNNLYIDITDNIDTYEITICKKFFNVYIDTTNAYLNVYIYNNDGNLIKKIDEYVEFSALISLQDILFEHN